MTQHNGAQWSKGIGTMAVSMVVSLLLAGVKAVAGIVGNSYALVADALESTSDVVSSFLGVIALRYASKPPDDDHPFGHGRAEPIVTFVVVGLLFLTATIIIYQSIINIRTPHELPATFTLLVLLAVIVIKEVMYRWVDNRGKVTGSTALRAEAQHNRSDALTSLVALLGISFALIMGPGYEAADDWAALIAAFAIIYNCYKIFRPAWGEIMDEQNHSELILKIKAIAEGVHGVRGTEKCYVRKTGMNYLVDLHLEVDGGISVEEGHEIAHKVQDQLKNSDLGIIYASMHVEPFERQTEVNGK